MTSEIISAIASGEHKLTPKEVVSVLIFVGVTVAVYAAEAFLIIGAVRSKRKGLGFPKRFWSGWATVIHLLAILGVACLLYGHLIEPGDMVIYESTVYPGATEDDCVPYS